MSDNRGHTVRTPNLFNLKLTSILNNTQFLQRIKYGICALSWHWICLQTTKQFVENEKMFAAQNDNQ